MTAEAGTPVDPEKVRDRVRDRYAALARGGGCCSSGLTSGQCCGGGSGECCGTDASSVVQLGYTSEEIVDLPQGAYLGLGCGNPTALLSLTPGETVLDLGSGGGVDCFLASRKVGPDGRVIGVDMTPEMVATARANARRGGFSNVEFRLGEIEHLPVADGMVDVVVSNCVINLVPDKGQAYREAFRVLRPGGRLAITDVVATRPISAEQRADPSLWSSCSSGALEIDRVREALEAGGFGRIELILRDTAEPLNSLRNPDCLGVVPADIRAIRPTV